MALQARETARLAEATKVEKVAGEIALTTHLSFSQVSHKRILPVCIFAWSSVVVGLYA